MIIKCKLCGNEQWIHDNFRLNVENNLEKWKCNKCRVGGVKIKNESA